MTERARIDFPSRIGVWWASETWPITEAQQVVAEIEDLGFGSLFLPEVVGKECLTQSAAFLAATRRLVVGTGIANIHVRIPSAAETGARTLTALHPGRFVLGLGVSHAPLVEYGMGGVYSKPLATMRDYLEKMAAVAPQIEPGAGRPPRLLAALGPKMIELSGELADGAHPYLVTPEQTRVTREILGPDKWVVSEQAISITGDDDAQLAHAHAHLDVYSGLPNYRNSWLRQGFDESDLVRGAHWSAWAAPRARRRRSGHTWTPAPTTSSCRHSERRPPMIPDRCCGNWLRHWAFKTVGGCGRR